MSMEGLPTPIPFSLEGEEEEEEAPLPTPIPFSLEGEEEEEEAPTSFTHTPTQQDIELQKRLNRTRRLRKKKKEEEEEAPTSTLLPPPPTKKREMLVLSHPSAQFPVAKNRKLKRDD
ncbi:hypothetical protein GBAR_LOCUS17996 [Geodia barretti]|uniref:Uncharacterized protein n=1 Tax=Geodia barretti TaxID=519541 RepID=A0AA35SMB2_GEOBA|nr:hypothetical protein GBAR_LOCUS17996 [Geodia barretti]